MKEPSSDHLDSVSNLRKHYAGLAMQAIIPAATSRTEDQILLPDKELVVRCSLEIADALIAELSKK